MNKMGQCFINWKKRLHLDYVVKEKTPDFKKIQFEKIKPFWAEFVNYKTSEKAKKMSATNKLNAANKKYHHTMGQGGYRAGIPKVPGDDNDDDDGAPTMAPIGYPVDDITQMTHCELHVKVVNISMKVAVGYALPIGPTPTYHCRPVPEGYAVVGVDEIMPTFEVLDLHYPAG